MSEYFFEAEFEDGTIIPQGDDSPIGTYYDDEGNRRGSRFTDVTAKSDESPLIRFSIRNDMKDFTLYLPTGILTVNGVAMLLELLPFPAELIYHRRKEVKADLTVTINEQLQPEVTDAKTSEPKLLYTALGFKGTNEKGELIERVIYIP